MTLEEIKALVNTLSVEERRELVRFIVQSLPERPAPSPTDFEQVSGWLGMDEDDPTLTQLHEAWRRLGQLE